MASRFAFDGTELSGRGGEVADALASVLADAVANYASLSNLDLIDIAEAFVIDELPEFTVPKPLVVASPLDDPNDSILF